MPDPKLCQLVGRAFGGWSAAWRRWALRLSLLSLTLALSMGAGYAGTTHLLGAFAAGMAFSRVPGVALLWTEHGEVTEWLASLFFASMGFVIPVGELFDPVSLGYGLLFTIPTVLGKLVTGAFAGGLADSLVVGTAMVGRGELGFVMVDEARGEDLLSVRPFVATVWALLLATLMSPFMMRAALGWKVREGGLSAPLGLGSPFAPRLTARHLRSMCRCDARPEKIEALVGVTVNLFRLRGSCLPAGACCGRARCEPPRSCLSFPLRPECGPGHLGMICLNFINRNKI